MFLPSKEVPTHNLRRATIANAVGSATYTVSTGMAIQPGATGHNKFVTQATSTSPILGVVMGLEFGGKIAEVNSITGVNSALGSLSATAGVYSDNESNTAPWKVVYVPSFVRMDFYATLSGTAGTTTNSNGLCYLNLIAATTGVTGGMQLDETSVTLIGTPGQFWSYGYVSEPVPNKTIVMGHWARAYNL